MPVESQSDDITKQAVLGNLLMRGLPAIKDTEIQSDLTAVATAVLIEVFKSPDKMELVGKTISRALKYAYHAGKNS